MEKGEREAFLPILENILKTNGQARNSNKNSKMEINCKFS